MGINVRVLLRTSSFDAPSAASWRLSAHDGRQCPCYDLADMGQALLQSWKDWLQSLCLELADLTPTFDATSLQSWASMSLPGVGRLDVPPLRSFRARCQSPCFESADLVPDQRQLEKGSRNTHVLNFDRESRAVRAGVGWSEPVQFSSRACKRRPSKSLGLKTKRSIRRSNTEEVVTQEEVLAAGAFL